MVTVSNEVKAQWANRTLQRNMQDGLGYITKLLATLELCTVQAVVLGMVLCPEHMMMVMALMNRAWLGLAKLARRSGAKFELPDLASLDGADADADAERRGTPRPAPLERDNGEEEEKEDGPVVPPAARVREPGPRAKPRRPAPAPRPEPEPRPRPEPEDETGDEDRAQEQDGAHDGDQDQDPDQGGDEDQKDEGEDEVDLDTLPLAVREAMLRSQGRSQAKTTEVQDVMKMKVSDWYKARGVDFKCDLTFEELQREESEEEKEHTRQAWVKFRETFGNATLYEAARMTDPLWQVQAERMGLDLRTGLPLEKKTEEKKTEEPKKDGPEDPDPKGGPSGPTGGGAPPPPPPAGGTPPPPPAGGAPPAPAAGASQASAASSPPPAPAAKAPAAAKAAAKPKPKVPPARFSYKPKRLPKGMPRCELLDLIDIGLFRQSAPILKPGGVAGTRDGRIPPQLGLLGKRFDEQERPGVLIDYNRSFAAAFFGVPEYGKSYALGVMLENAVNQMDMGNVLPEPYCGFVLHYHPNATYQSEFLASRFPNCEPGEVEKLVKQYGILPQGFDDMMVLTLPEYVKELREENPYTAVYGLGFALRSLKLGGLKILFGFGLGEESPLYQRQVEEMLRKLWEKHGNKLRLKHLEDAIARTKFRDKHTRELVESRLEIARPWINDDQDPREFVQPGRLIIFDIREGWVPHETAMMLFALANNTMCLTKGGGKKMVVIDEAHKFAKVPIIRQQMGVMVRERRHLRLSLLLSCQDPGGLPGDLLPLLDMVGVFHHESEDWNRTLGKAIAAFQIVKVEMTSALRAGQMLFWARQWFQLVGGYEWKDAPIIVEVRPRASQHGGHTEESVRQPSAA